MSYFKDNTRVLITRSKKVLRPLLVICDSVREKMSLHFIKLALMLLNVDSNTNMIEDHH